MRLHDPHHEPTPTDSRTTKQSYNNLSQNRDLFTRLRFPLLCELVAIAIFALVTWIARTSSKINIPLAGFRVDATSTLTLLSIFQGALSILSTLILTEIFELIQWTCLGRKSGLPTIRLLGLSPTTRVLGQLRIMFHRNSTVGDRLWPAFRFTLSVALWVSSVVLFANTSLGTAYESLETYDLTAGVGQFNGSLVRPYLQKLQDSIQGYPYTIVPYSMQSIVYNLVSNPMYSTLSTPVNCSDANCDSYLLSGGLMMATPWAPTTHPSASVVQIFDVPAAQMDFTSGLRDQEPFVETDCDLFGDTQTPIGIRFCVSQSKANPSSFNAGLYVCPNGTQNNNCPLNPRTPLPNITTTFTLFSRTASIVAARSNASIISLTSLSPPTQTLSLDLANFRLALRWILDYNAAKIPAPSSIAEQFWSAQSQLQNTYWAPELTQIFHSILAFPVWKFNPNNFGNLDLDARVISPELPEEFHTRGEIAVPHVVIRISTAMFGVFVAVHAVVRVFVWGVLVWVVWQKPIWGGDSSFPLIDFALGTRCRGRGSGLSDVGSGSPEVVKGGNREVLAVMGGYNYYLARKEGGCASASQDTLVAGRDSEGLVFSHSL